MRVINLAHGSLAIAFAYAVYALAFYYGGQPVSGVCLDSAFGVSHGVRCLCRRAAAVVRVRGHNYRRARSMLGVFIGAMVPAFAQTIAAMIHPQAFLLGGHLMFFVVLFTRLGLGSGNIATRMRHLLGRA